MKKKRNKIICIISAALIVSVCAAVSLFAFQLAIISGASMLPAYKSYSFVLINRTENDFHRGDVVAFKCGAGTLIKRIAAEPNDSVVIKDGSLLVNGEKSALYSGKKIAFAGLAQSEIKLGEDEYFVLGDNTDESKDSRYEIVGIVQRSEIKGKIIPQKTIN